MFILGAIKSASPPFVKGGKENKRLNIIYIQVNNINNQIAS